MPSGLRVIAETEGAGLQAEKGDAVGFDCAAYLNKGAVVHPRRSERIVLGSRRLIAGVEQSLVGMREGGYRKVRISPHLAYRAAGIEGKVPPNAVLVYEFWLTSVEKGRSIQMKAPANEYSAFVEHPRFGKGPQFTGLDPVNTPDGKVFCHWHSGPGVRVPNTAIAAHVPSQRPATVPVTHYFDSRRICRKCKKPFLFFAKEQKYWYEELEFPLEADCLECVPCRKDEQQLRVARQKYDALLAVPSRAESDTLALVECAVLLVESAVFSRKLVQNLRGLVKPILAASEPSSRTRAAALWSRLAEDE